MQLYLHQKETKRQNCPRSRPGRVGGAKQRALGAEAEDAVSEGATVPAVVKEFIVGNVRFSMLRVPEYNL